MTTTATETEPIDLPQLIKLVHAQRELYRLLRRMADTQGQLVSENDPEPLLKLLHQRQRVVDELTAVNTDLQPYRQRWSQVWAQVPADEQESLAALLKESQEDLKTIIDRDDRDRAGLEAARDRVASQIRKTASGQGAINAYRQTPGSSVGSGPSYTDRQG